SFPHLPRIGLRHRPASQKRINADRLSHLWPHENPPDSIGAEHALAVTALVSEQDFATVLDRRLKRIEEMKLLEVRVVNGKPRISERIIEPEPPPAPPPLNGIYDKRRYRRI